MHRCHLSFLFLLSLLASIVVACTGSQSQYNDIIDSAESISLEDPDSALTLLDAIDPIEITVDSLKAKYYLLLASIHDSQGHLMLADSLIKYSAV